VTPTRVATVLLAFAVLIVAALLLAAAKYHDDEAQQPWQYEIGMATFRIGFPILLIAAITMLIWLRRRDR
jgi:heme/copper-type cytochrome/quinol oxidase subunit 2